MSKILLIGIDSATWKEINPLINKGKLPIFSKIMSKGCYGNLKPIKGFKSPALWNSAVTGKTPEKHGIEFFSTTKLKLGKIKIDLSNNLLTSAYNCFFRLFYKDNYGALAFPRKVLYWLTRKLGNFLKKLGVGDNYIVTSKDRKVKALWNIFSQKNKTAGMVGWWASWPSEEVNGFIISEKSNDFLLSKQKKSKAYRFSSERQKLVYPHNILKETESFIKENLTEKHIKKFFNNLSEKEKKILKSKEYIPNNRLSMFKYNFNIDSFYFNTGLHFLEKYNPDIFCLYMVALDPIQHIFWQYSHPEDFEFLNLKDKDIKKYKEVIPQYYQYLDKKLGKIIEKMNEEDILIVMSDHGMEAIPQKKYNPKSVRSGQHDNCPDGIFMIYGKNIKKNHSLKGVDVLDITPTILYLSGLPIAKDMDGEIITEIFKDFDISKVEYIDTYEENNKEKKKDISYSDEEQKEIKQRLKDLGYI